MKITILIDATYLDQSAAGLKGFLSTQIGRDLAQADLARWLDCIALDAGLRPGSNDVQAVFLHSKEQAAFSAFSPANFAHEIDGKAFKDNLGEFELKCAPVEEIVSLQEMLTDCIEMLYSKEGETPDKVVVVAEEVATDKAVTLCNMYPDEGWNIPHINLGYSLLSAYGINPDEL